MSISKRRFLQSAIATGAIMMIPFRARAGEAAFSTEGGGGIAVYPIHHASIILTTSAGTIYVDPVGEPALYADHPSPDLILITHEHGDHFNIDTLKAISTDATKIITNPAVGGMLSDDVAASERAVMANNDSQEWNGVGIDAIPAYNTTEDRLNFHPQGRDNGYILNIDGYRIYISGDTEDIPEMRALSDIDLCFLCMNLPFTQTAEQAASAVMDFKPKVVFPYHYRGKDDGSQDPKHFAELVGDNSQVEFYDWYKES